MSSLTPLPIDPLLPSLIESLREHRSLVLEAPPGAGKTTRVPRALLDASLFPGEIVVLEPRRLAARLAARRVADELGEKVGERAGYRVRFEDVSSAKTRIRFVTEGTLTRQLLADPELRNVGAVLLDEFHERHLQGDLALALLMRLQATKRPDLRLVVMSATLDGERIAAHLGAPVLRAEGRRFAVTIEHAPKPDDRPLSSQVSSALREILRRGDDGHVLVFLPGAREIRQAMDACAPIASSENMAVFPLHGDLSGEEQDAAVGPSARRKLILATNVAESSVTIDGVAAVIDAGLAKVMTHSPWTGLASLKTAKVSQASATQRAGRAGRTREGIALRLYTKHDHDTRPQHDVPEIQRADLTETLLELSSQGIEAKSFGWLDAPSDSSLEAARTLLVRLGAIDDARGDITELGKKLLRFPLHPRLARLVVSAEDAGFGRDGCALAALLSERDPRLANRASFGERRGDSRGSMADRSDALSRLEDLGRASRERLSPGELRSRGLDPGAVSAIDRARKQLERQLRARDRGDDAFDEDREDALEKALLQAFPDRVARRRRAGTKELVLSSGGSATQAESSVVHGAPFVVVLETNEPEDRRLAASGILATRLSAIEPDWLLELFPEQVRDARELVWNADAERVEVIERLMYEKLAIDETRRTDLADEDVANALADAARKRGLAAFVNPPDALYAFLERARFVGENDATFPRFDDEGLAVIVRSLCQGRRSFAELREADLVGELSRTLTHAQTSQLAAWAPSRIELKGGRHAKVSYEPGKPPFAMSKLQDFFGTLEAPRVAGGRVGLVLHLLAPNQRPVQITSDLAGFWKTHYPDIKRELSRRYPRQAWPDDPTVPLPQGWRPARR